MPEIIDIKDFCQELQADDADIDQMTDDDLRFLVAVEEVNTPLMGHTTFGMAHEKDDQGAFKLPSEVDYMVYEGGSASTGDKDIKGVEGVVFDGKFTTYDLPQYTWFQKLGINVEDPSNSIHARTNGSMPDWEDNFDFHVGDRNGEVLVTIEGNTIHSKIPVTVHANPECNEISTGSSDDAPEVGGGNNPSLPDMPLDYDNLCIPIQKLDKGLHNFRNVFNYGENLRGSIGIRG